MVNFKLSRSKFSLLIVSLFFGFLSSPKFSIASEIFSEISYTDSFFSHNNQNQDQDFDAISEENNFDFSPITLTEALFSQSQAIAQGNYVHQLRELSPQDWASQALKNLVEKYNCLEGYPDRSFQGDRSLSRYEFAAGLNSCLTDILLIRNQPLEEEELEQIQRLLRIFRQELTQLKNHTDLLETRINLLENNQFSLTTKFDAKTIIATVATSNNENINNQITLGYVSRLNFNSSFNGQDNLFVSFASYNLNSPHLGTPEGGLAFTTFAGNNDLIIDALSYSFPLNHNTAITLVGAGGISTDIADTINRLDGDGELASLTNFGTRNPIYYQIKDKGIAIKHHFNDQVNLSLGYMASSAENPHSGQGLLNGDYSGLAQLLITPNDDLKIAFTYLHSYNQSDTGTGSNLANFRQYTADNFGQAIPTSSNSYGLEFSWQLSDHFVLGAWGGYSNICTLSTLNDTLNRGNLDVWNWAVTFAFPNLGNKGSLGGIVIGMEPKVTDSNINFLGSKLQDQDTSFHLEAFYQYAINDHLSITPGVVYLTAPDHNKDNGGALIATLRTVFVF